MTFGISSFFCIALATLSLSPVNITTSIPISPKDFIACMLLAFSTSDTAITPSTLFSSANASGVLPSSDSESMIPATSGDASPHASRSL